MAVLSGFRLQRIQCHLLRGLIADTTAVDRGLYLG